MTLRYSSSTWRRQVLRSMSAMILYSILSNAPYGNQGSNLVQGFSPPSPLLPRYRSHLSLRTSPSTLSLSSTAATPYDNDDNDENDDTSPPPLRIDPLLASASKALRRSSWLSWWTQVILSTISAVTLIFAKSVLSSSPGMGGRSSDVLRNASGGFLLAGSGIGLSFLSIIWTWGETRLSRRLLRRPPPSRIAAANLTRRAITIGISINLLGMAMTLLGAEQIVGVLAAKSLSMQSWNGGVGMATQNFVSQTLQPLDILIVQANTNTLLSHFCSLCLMLWWGQRWIGKLDPPSQEEEVEKRRGRRFRGTRR